MSDQPPSDGNQQLATTESVPPINQPSRDTDYRSEREIRREERHARRAASGTAWVGGVVLIVLGIIFLLQNVRGFYLNNWWALFILIPAIGAFADAWNRSRQDGRFSRRARGALITGCVLLLVTATFLFNWNWGIVLPVLLIVWGISILLNSLLPD